MSDWFDARVVDVSPAAEGLVHVRLSVPREVLESYTTPGQYVKISPGSGGEGFFAIASGPGAKDERIALLIKLGGAVADAIAGLAPGSTVRTTKAQGKGFPIDRAVGQDLVLVATGSGISAIRSVIEAVLARRADFGKVSLYFGARTPTAFAYREEWEGWRGAGVDVAPVASRPGDAEWTGLTGYVQTHLGGVHLSTAIAFLCGQKAMVEAVKAALAERGMPAGSVFLNF